MHRPIIKRLPQCLYGWCLSFVVSILVAVIIIGGIEFTLRFYGFGESREPMIEKEVDGFRFYVPNKAFYQQFFNIPLYEFVNWDDLDFCVPVEKSPNAIRIFVFGESAMYGLQSSARQLEVMLKERFPFVKWEVYNFSCPGINSHLLHQLAKYAIRLSPDMFIVYMGNNEAIGPYGENSFFGRFNILRRIWVIRLHIFLKRLRVVQLFERLPSSEWRKYLPVDMSKYIPGQSQHLLTLKLYKKNLSDIVAEGVKSNADVIVGTLSFNRLYGMEETATMPKFEETSMNRIIKEVVERFRTCGGKVYLADIDWILASNAPQGVPDYTFFCDNIHFNFEGNYLVAREWFDKVAEALNRKGLASFPKKATPIPIEECARNLGWSDATELELIGLQKKVILDSRSQVVLAEKEKALIAKVDGNISEKVLATYAIAYSLNPDDEKIAKQYVESLLKAGMKDRAFEVVSALYKTKPYLRISMRLMGNVYSNLGDFANAERMYKLCLKYYPDDGLAMDSLKLISKRD